MDVVLLSTLRELRDRGSVTAVAQALHLSPSAVSQQLATLQRSCAAPLTRKQGRRLVLTAAGEELVRASQELFVARARLEQLAARLGHQDEQVVHLAALHSAALTWFPQLLADERWRVCCHDFDLPAESFVSLTGEVDIVIAQRPGREDVWPEGALEVVPLLTEDFDIVLRTDHPLATLRLRPEDLVELEWIAVHADYPMAGQLDHLGLHLGQQPRIRHRINEFPTACAMVAASDLACLLPRHTASIDAARLVRLPVPGVRLSRRIDALVRPEKLQRTGVRELLQRLQELAAAPPE